MTINIDLRHPMGLCLTHNHERSIYLCISSRWNASPTGYSAIRDSKQRYGVATISRLLKIISLVCKRALWKRLYSAKGTYNFKEPTNCSHPIRHPMSLCLICNDQSSICISIHIYILLHTHIYWYVYMYVLIYRYVYVYIYECIYIYIFIYICMYVCIYIYIYIHIYIYIYIYINI